MDHDPQPGTGRLALRLALFVVAGAAAAVVLWHALNSLLAGQPPESPVWLVAAAVLLLAALVLALRRFVRRLGSD